MALTLVQLLFTQILWGCVGIALYLCFGFAVFKEWNIDLTPRAASRPKSVLKNVLQYKNYDEDEEEQEEDEESDNSPTATNKARRGVWCFPKFYPVSWFCWAYSLTNKQMMEGLSGTGTSSNGWTGPRLKLNLDNIILLNYHVLLGKVAVVATIVCVLLLLPSYRTATCDPRIFGAGNCYSLWNLTDFDNLTIAHVPDLWFIAYNETLTFDYKGESITVEPQEYTDPEDYELDFEWVVALTWRYAMTFICAGIIYGYAMYLIYQEWISNLALRRVYFLEAEHYPRRLQELDRIAIHQENQLKQEKQQQQHPHTDDNDDDPTSVQSLLSVMPPSRAPNLPDPTIRDTVPSVGLYSVLYQLPRSIVVQARKQTAVSKLEYLRNETVTFFDALVSPQPGFSSSVVACTIVPNANKVAACWRVWWELLKRARRIRYIKQLLHQKQEKENEKKDGDDAKAVSVTATTTVCVGNVDDSQTTKPPTIDATETEQPKTEQEAASTTTSTTEEEETTFAYATFDMVEYAKSIGFYDETVLLQDVVHGLGVEEMAQFAREYGQTSASPCVYGKTAYVVKLHLMSSDELVETAKDLIDEMYELNQELQIARQVVVEDDDKMLVKTKSKLSLEYSTNKNKDDVDDVEAPSEIEAAPTDFVVPSPSNNNQEIIMGSSNLNSNSTTNDDENTTGLRHRFVKTAPAVTTAASTSTTSDGAPTTTVAPQRGRYSMFASRRIPLGDQWDMAEEEMKQDDESLDDSASFEEEEGHDDDNDEKAHKRSCFRKFMKTPTFAVVTFTSRSKAITARQCLVDARITADSWKQVDDIPIAPLADAPRDPFFFRGCCRPLTLETSYQERKLRRWTVYIFMLVFTVTYAIIISQLQQLFNPDFLARQIDGFDPNSLYASLISSMSGLFKTLIQSFLPHLFKLLAFFEGTSSSMEKAERKALFFYWIFILLSAFTGTSLATMFRNITYVETTPEAAFWTTLFEISDSILRGQTAIWINWIINRYCFTFPGGYLLQMNNFIFKALNWKWLNRQMKGGGAGAPTPYRIYVDSAIVFLCVTLLSPVCPLIAPAALIYFIVAQPILRWLLMFTYRARYDAGGDKWPQLHNVLISAIIFSQIMLTAIFVVKGSFWSLFVIFVYLIPTIFFHLWTVERFLRAYSDCALLQNTQLLQKYSESTTPPTLHEREEYRHWLVDCHKASYVPICLVGGQEDEPSLLTAEPAVVIPRPTDDDDDDGESEGQDAGGEDSDLLGVLPSYSTDTKATTTTTTKRRGRRPSSLLMRQKTQRGAIFSPRDV